MLQLSTREFNQNICKYLKLAPLQITKRKVVVATILPGISDSKKAAEAEVSENAGLDKTKKGL